MAKPSTRQGLIDYCLRQLGAPVLEINVDDDQIDDLVDDTIQYFNERHYDGVEKMYLKYKITQGDIDRGIGAVSAGSDSVDSIGISGRVKIFLMIQMKQSIGLNVWLGNKDHPRAR